MMSIRDRSPPRAPSVTLAAGVARSEPKSRPPKITNAGELSGLRYKRR